MGMEFRMEQPPFHLPLFPLQHLPPGFYGGALVPSHLATPPTQQPLIDTWTLLLCVLLPLGFTLFFANAPAKRRRRAAMEEVIIVMDVQDRQEEEEENEGVGVLDGGEPVGQEGGEEEEGEVDNVGEGQDGEEVLAEEERETDQSLSILPLPAPPKKRKSLMKKARAASSTVFKYFARM